MIVKTDYPVSLPKHLNKCFVCGNNSKVNYRNKKCVTRCCENECSQAIKNVFMKQQETTLIL